MDCRNPKLILHLANSFFWGRWKKSIAFCLRRSTQCLRGCRTRMQYIILARKRVNLLGAILTHLLAGIGDINEYWSQRAAYILWLLLRHSFWYSTHFWPSPITISTTFEWRKNNYLSYLCDFEPCYFLLRDSVFANLETFVFFLSSGWSHEKSWRPIIWKAPGLHSKHRLTILLSINDRKRKSTSEVPFTVQSFSILDLHIETHESDRGVDWSKLK
jgi:hypothetical protein